MFSAGRSTWALKLSSVKYVYSVYADFQTDLEKIWRISGWCGDVWGRVCLYLQVHVILWVLSTFRLNGLTSLVHHGSCYTWSKQHYPAKKGIFSFISYLCYLNFIHSFKNLGYALIQKKGGNHNTTSECKLIGWDIISWSCSLLFVSKIMTVSL